MGPNGVVRDGTNHPQFASAQAFTAQMIARYPNANIVFTGDSLGGYLSTLLSYNHPDAVAIAFDAPGVDVGQLGTNDNVFYYYTELWGVGGTLVHSLGDRASGNVLFISGTSGHDIESIIGALQNGTGRLITLQDVQDRAVAFHTIHDARLIASQTGVSFAEVVSHQLIGAINDDRQLLNSDAFKSMVGELLGDNLNAEEVAHVWGEVVHETNGQCFPAGTLISMANGTQRRIEDIRAGDIVLSFDPATGAHLPRAVTKLYPGETEVWINLTYGQNGMEKSRSTTPEHPFLTPDGQFAPILQPIGEGERWAA